MGIFNKINERSGVIVTVIVVALVLFILGGDLIGGGSFFSGNNNKVAEIAGEDVSYQEYSKTLEMARNAYAARTGRPVTDNEMTQVHNQAWSELVYQYAYPEQFEELGLTVSEEEIEEMVSGKNLHPQILQSFPDSVTGEFNRKSYEQFKSSPQGQEIIDKFKKDIALERIRMKYLNLFQNGTYVTKEEAKREYKAQNNKADVKYLYIPFYSIPDDSVKITDEDIQNYINNHKKEFKLEDRRSLEFVEFLGTPSAKDSAEIQKELKELASDFATTDQDSLFAASNADNPSAPSLMGMGQLPEELREKADSLKIGSVYGPFTDQQTKSLKIYKITDIVEDPKDTMGYASARHILFKTQESMTAQQKDSVRKKAEQVLAQLKGGADFAEMVMKYSDDPGSKNTGGEYKWFPKGQMVPAFDKAVFSAKSEGLVSKPVETDFGYHIIDVTDTKTSKKFKVATVDKSLIALDGKETAYQKANSFRASVKDTASFREAVKKDSLNVQKAENIKAMDGYVGSLVNPREVIRWAFNDADEGDVSPVFTVGENYVVAVLTRKKDKETVEPEDVKNQIESKVLAEKKAELIMAKLKDIQGDIPKKAQAYGPQALTGTAPEVTLVSGSMPGIGYDPVVVGTIFGLVPGKRTVPIKGENGIAVLELVKINEAAEVADYSGQKTSLLQQRKNGVMTDVDKAIREEADIEDNRVKFF